MELSLFYQLEQLLLVPVPTAKGGETTQQDVEDHTQSPYVHSNAVTCWVKPQSSYWTVRIILPGSRINILTSKMFCAFVFLQQQHAPTRLTEDLRGHIRGRAAYSEDRFGHNHRKTKVSQLQPTDVSSFTLYLR